ncbi:hypothetical protein ACFL0D_03845 [Thermoproteota archaeon]
MMHACPVINPESRLTLALDSSGIKVKDGVSMCKPSGKNGRGMGVGG